MKIAIGADHAGVELKKVLTAELLRDGHDVRDMGVHDSAPSDYPDVSRTVGNSVASGDAERGILVCGSGVGASIAANKIRGIRAGVCHDTYSAHQAVEHDDMNILCLGARVIGTALASDIVRTFTAARFSNEERHRRRVSKILDIEAKQR